MAYSNEDCDRSRRLSAKDQEWLHRSSTRWPSDREVGWHCVRSAPCTWRREARVSWLSLEMKVYDVSGLASKPLGWFSLVWPQNRQLGFPCSGLKISSSSLVIWASKSPRRFLGLGLKTKRALVYRLRPKTNGGRTTWDMRRDLVACFACKHVTLGFSNPASRLAEARWRVVHVALSRRLHQNQVEDGRVDVTGCVGPCYP
jgi:hypothetical protein